MNHKTPLLLLSCLAAGLGAPALASDNPFTLSTKGGIKIANQDKSATFQLGGRLQYDYDATESEDNGVDTTDYDVRRARIYVKGTVGDWGYKAQFNVAESDGAKGGNAEDLYISYLGFGSSAQVTLGKQAEPFGLERLMSSKDISSLERTALTELLTPGRASGVKLHGAGKRWSYAVGVFEADGDGKDDFGNQAITGRATYAPYLSDNGVIHMGASFTDRDGDDNSDITTYGLELAAAQGPFHIQAEYVDSDYGDQDLDGYYVQAGWVITGESRPYKKGNFKRVTPAGSKGAWELVLRYEDGDGSYGDIGLDKKAQIFSGTQTTFGVNYYATDMVRLGLNYMTGDARDADGVKFDGDELRMRVQFAF